ncbi:MAG: hypothetical protein RQ751_05465, partial [Longimicrobiales bacterium]|nr:hypothetical protein [Longimicrobiales bacterium]
PAETWWCPALRGYALHALQRYVEAEGAFRRALAARDPEEAERWTDPAILLGREGRARVSGRVEAAWWEGAGFWEMADPLFLVPGNDRWTEHLARQVLARIRDGAVNPYGLRWGDDLTEALVRFGPEAGWERVRPGPADRGAAPGAVGQHHPESRGHLPPAAALAGPGGTPPEAWNPAGRRNPAAVYAPAYAPVVLPVPGPVLRFPRGDSLVLAARLELPPDTTWHRGHGHPTLPVPPAFRGLPPRVGLFALRSGSLAAADTAPGVSGSVRIALPPGEYLVSGEVWAPDSLRAGRVREGITFTGFPPDLPTLSDLILAEADGTDPATLEEALPALRDAIPSGGDRFRVGWEVHGLGWHPETLEYALEVHRVGGGLLRRLGGLLGLGGAGERVELAWREEGPRAPGPHFRSTEVELPTDAAPGDYRIRVTVRMPGREPLTAERTARMGARLR